MIKLTGEQVNDLYHDSKKNLVKGYEGWSIDVDEKTGDFDSGKGAFMDFEIYLYNPDGFHVATGIGGWYSQYEYYFDEDVEFEEIEPITEMDKFNGYLREVADNAIKASSEIAEMEAKLKLIGHYISGLKLVQGTKEY